MKTLKNYKKSAKKLVSLPLLILLTHSLVGCGDSSSLNIEAVKSAENLNLVPFPNNIAMKAGEVNFAHGLKFPEHQYKAYVDERLSSINIPVNKGIEVSINLAESPELGKEGYKLSSKDGVINLTAASQAGIFYGVQTLLQLAESGKVANFNIIDKPSFKWRSFMLDEARYFKGKEVVKNLLDEMARLKMNVFHWHLTDDAGWRVEIKKYPLLTEIGSKRKDTQINDNGKKWDSTITAGKPHEGFYTQEDIKEIVEYASALNITIVPEVSMPGHASAAVASYPWLGTFTDPIEVPVMFGVLKTVYNPANEKTIQFVHDVLAELSVLFPGDVIHIGGDEVKYEQWKSSDMVTKYMQQNNLATYSDVQVKFTNDVSNYIESSLGKRMMGWNEIMGLHVHDWSKDRKNATTALSKSAIVHFWRGTAEHFQKAIDAGHQVVNSNHTFTYLDYTYEKIDLKAAYSFNPVPEGLSAEKASQILGLGTQMWGEWIPSEAEMYYQTFPRIAAYAETAWTEKANKSYDRFKPSAEHLIRKWKLRGIATGPIESEHK